MMILLCPKCKSDNIEFAKCYPTDNNGNVMISEGYNHTNKLQCNECGEIFEPNGASIIVGRYNERR
jgi:uncharacterized protein YbaR (Trm112 family)